MRTFLEFQHHIELHRERVIKLGLTLAQHQFPRLHRGILADFLALHDFSKTIVSRSQLPQFNYSHRDLPVQRLYTFYGRTPKTESEMQRLMDIITDINDIDKKVGEDFFAKHPQLSWGVQEDFYTIERVADLVDRSLDPMAAEEFGHSMLLASEYIDDPYMSRLSLWLESHYPQITKNLSFSTVS
ncbi:MAG: hypothetical protein JSU04_13270 [Bdellovibrionales bacterium]|nr:hypothetical protein [Bdellovibrionales bacterium]